MAQPARRRGSRLWLIILGAVVAVVIGVVLIVQVFFGGGTKTKWYDEGYAIGKDKAAAMAKLGSSPDAACSLALMGTIKFDDNPRSTRVKDLRRGCRQAVEDTVG